MALSDQERDKLDKIASDVVEIKTNCLHCNRIICNLETEVYGHENFKGIKSRVTRLEWIWSVIVAGAGMVGGIIGTASGWIVHYLTTAK